MNVVWKALVIVLVAAASGYIGYNHGSVEGASGAKLLAETLPSSATPDAPEAWTTGSHKDEMTDIVMWMATSTGREGTGLTFTCTSRGFDAYFDAKDLYGHGEKGVAEYRVDADPAVRGLMWGIWNGRAEVSDPASFAADVLDSENLLVTVYDRMGPYTGHFSMIGAKEAVDYIRAQCAIESESK